MDLFLSNINYLIYLKYVYYHFPIKSIIKHLDKRIVIQDKNEILQVTFWDNQVIELQVNDDKQLNYYLHFEFNNFEKANKLFEDFVVFYSNSQLCQSRVLICCSGGLTSSYFAEGLKNYAKMNAINIQVEACSYTSINQNVDDYDLVLLAPQIHYLLPKYKQYANIELMPTNIYATYNYFKALNLIQNKKKC